MKDLRHLLSPGRRRAYSFALDAGATLGRALWGAVALLALGQVLIVITDGAYGYERINNLYVTGTVLDAGWPLGYTLIGLAAYVVGLTPAASPVEEPGGGPTVTEQRLWISLLPYALAPAVVLLAFYAWRHSGGSGNLATGVYVGGRSWSS